MRTLCYGLLLVTAGVWPVHAAPITQVQVAVGKVSEVVLPEKVAKVLKGGAADSILVEVIDHAVYLLPKSNTPADIYVTGVSGASYPLRLVSGAQPDVHVDVASDASHIQVKAMRPSALDLIKDLLRGIIPAGSTAFHSNQEVRLARGRIVLSVDVIYDFPRVAAYVFTARNQSSERVTVPLEQLTFPRLLAAHAASDVLEPNGLEGDSTTVYLVAGK